jgi:hypothetical protein
MSDTYKGTCFCGAVAFEATGAPVFMGYCHCTDCRTWLGAPVNGFAMWAPPNVRITKGAEHVGSFNKTEKAYRKFCKTCGGAVMTELRGFGLVELFPALMPGFAYQPAMHVFYAEKMLPMKDGLPKFKDLPANAGGSGEMLAE